MKKILAVLYKLFIPLVALTQSANTTGTIIENNIQKEVIFRNGSIFVGDRDALLLGEEQKIAQTTVSSSIAVLVQDKLPGVICMYWPKYTIFVQNEHNMWEKGPTLTNTQIDVTANTKKEAVIILSSDDGSKKLFNLKKFIENSKSEWKLVSL